MSMKRLSFHKPEQRVLQDPILPLLSIRLLSAKQSHFKNRFSTARVHNVDNFISSDLRSFRNALLYNYYFPALSAVYDPEGGGVGIFDFSVLAIF